MAAPLAGDAPRRSRRCKLRGGRHRGGAPIPGSIHAFLRGDGHDGRGRLLAEVLAFDDARIEAAHDFIQWPFPLPDASRAVPGAPVLGTAEAAAIGGDAQALDGLRAGLARMTRFYAETDGWLIGFDHNHLRITRIILAVRHLLGAEAAAAFHGFVLGRHGEAGSPVNAGSLRHWSAAAGPFGATETKAGPGV